MSSNLIFLLAVRVQLWTRLLPRRWWTTIIGGGDAAAKNFGTEDKSAMSLPVVVQLLEGKELPGVAALDDA